MTRRWLFAIHWALGLTAGIVLMIMGVSGAAIAFKDELNVLLGPGVARIEPRTDERLAPARLAEIAQHQYPDFDIRRMILIGKPGSTVEMRLVPHADPDAEHDIWFDPYDGRALGRPAAYDVLEFLTALHRFLALPGRGDGPGRQITGVAALALIFFALSGLYLRWPKRARDWRSWFVIDRRLTGRNLYRALHVVIGTWMVAFYLFAALTGLWWSYDWYQRAVRATLTGVATQRSEPMVGLPGGAGATSFAAAWRGFTAVRDPTDYDYIRIDRPREGKGAGVRFRARLVGGRHDRVADYFTIDGRDGRLVSADLYAERPLGEDLTNSMLELHEGSYFGLAGRILMLIAASMLLFFGSTGALMYLKRRQRLSRTVPEGFAGSGDGTGTVVAYASQTGTAERLARATAAAFPGAALVPIDRLDDAMLARTKRLLLVASTYGEGEPPDHARLFERRVLSTAPAAVGIDYAVLALGDREYEAFCDFGHRLDRWMRDGGGNRLFPTVELDGADPHGQQEWAGHLEAIGARTVAAPADDVFRDMTMIEREWINRGSHGGKVFRVVLEPRGARLDWRAGDIAEVLPAGSAAFGSSQPRDYSIASLPASGAIELLVRLVQKEGGEFGVASGHLAYGSRDDPIRMRLRRNKGFHAPEDASRPLILVGNGTGLAGLIAHVRERARLMNAGQAAGPVWLLFGERSADRDAYFDDELRHHLSTGTLARLDRTWSRDGTGPRYVQDAVAAQLPQLRDWLAREATIMVCGSAKGMGEQIDYLLREALGSAELDILAASRRYVRDVY